MVNDGRWGRDRNIDSRRRVLSWNSTHWLSFEAKAHARIRPLSRCGAEVNNNRHGGDVNVFHGKG